MHRGSPRSYRDELEMPFTPYRAGHRRPPRRARASAALAVVLFAVVSLAPLNVLGLSRAAA